MADDQGPGGREPNDKPDWMWVYLGFLAFFGVGGTIAQHNPDVLFYLTLVVAVVAVVIALYVAGSGR